MNPSLPLGVVSPPPGVPWPPPRDPARIAAALAGATPLRPTRRPGAGPARAAVLLASRAGKGSHGLGVNAAHTAAVLPRLGVPTEAVEVDGLAELAAHIGPATRVVVLQAVWYAPEELHALAARSPGVRFVVRSHSNLAFLAVEPATLGTIRAAAGPDAPPNVLAGCVSDRLSRWLDAAYGLPAAHLPNLYDLAAAPARPDRDPDGPLKLGAFGALRLQKHTVVAAGAALVVARQLGRPVELHLNTGRHDAGILAMIRGMFAGAGAGDASLVEAPWMPHADFSRYVAGMDLCLQPSASETYNYVTADAAAASVPSVVGEAIEWMPPDSMAPVDDPVAVAEAALRLLADPTAGPRARLALEAHQRSAEWAWLDWLGPPASALLRNARACPHRHKIPDAERPGCGCAHRCAAGHGDQSGGGTTVTNCWACPIAPRRTPALHPGAPM